MKNNNQPFHLVTLSPWPLLSSISLLTLTTTSVFMFNFNNYENFFLSLILLLMCMYQWWRDIIRESSFQGSHSIHVSQGLKLGMILFIISEVFFFISFFWSYFHISLSPSIELGSNWPPFGMKYMLINPFYLPLLNTIILVSSGMFLSMAHYSILKKNFNMSYKMIMLTLIFGMIFTLIQLSEYYNAPFSIFNSSYGSIFFMMTGFHGLHVLIGTIFIYISMKRLKFSQFSNIHHLGLEMSAWYWHFVDVIWLFLFLFIYWWPY